MHSTGMTERYATPPLPFPSTLTGKSIYWYLSSHLFIKEGEVNYIVINSAKKKARDTGSIFGLEPKWGNNTLSAQNRDCDIVKRSEDKLPWSVLSPHTIKGFFLL